MPIKKADTSAKSAIENEVIATLKHAAQKLTTTVKEVKQHYDEADDKTKKKIIAGVAGAAALIAATIGVKQAMKKKKK